MSIETPSNSPEKKEVLEDNARKFTTEPIDVYFLNQHDATSFYLTVDWLEMGQDNEKKVAYKEFDNGDIQILLIAKTTKDGNRTASKDEISIEKYRTLSDQSIRHVKKKRHEFIYTQNNLPFSVKYDEFTNSRLKVLEVDAADEESRNTFSADDFPYELKEVTGNLSYYGYRIADIM